MKPCIYIERQHISGWGFNFPDLPGGTGIGAEIPGDHFSGEGWPALKAHFGVRGAHNWWCMGECFCSTGQWEFGGSRSRPASLCRHSFSLSPIGAGCPPTITMLLTLKLEQLTIPSECIKG